MPPRKPRHLSPEEEKLWSRVTDTATPMQPARGRALDPGAVFKSKPARKIDVPQFRVGETAKPKSKGHVLTPSIAEQVAGAPVQMDKKSFAKMKRGKLSPDARIDLHGLTIAQAHDRLIGFVLSAHSRGDRLVLVITGKGKRRDDTGPIPARIGALRHQVPHWLSQHPLKPIVLQVAQASQNHGGSGAYYVYLRRHR